jgi:hypothetical protein
MAAPAPAALPQSAGPARAQPPAPGHLPARPLTLPPAPAQAAAAGPHALETAPTLQTRGSCHAPSDRKPCLPPPRGQLSRESAAHALAMRPPPNARARPGHGGPSPSPQGGRAGPATCPWGRRGGPRASCVPPSPYPNASAGAPRPRGRSAKRPAPAAGLPAARAPLCPLPLPPLLPALTCAARGAAFGPAGAHSAGGAAAGSAPQPDPQHCASTAIECERRRPALRGHARLREPHGSLPLTATRRPRRGAPHIDRLEERQAVGGPRRRHLPPHSTAHCDLPRPPPPARQLGPEE